MRIRDLVGVSTHRQRQIARLLELSLIGMCFIGLYIGRLGIVINAGIGVAVTQLVPLLERDYGIPMDPALTLWITLAVFLHGFGTIPLPAEWVSFFGSVPAGQERVTLYSSGGMWDHLTHTFSASVVAAVGYATTRALHEHTEAIHIPPRFMFVFVVQFVIAFGVLWEVLEFALGGVSTTLGSGSVLTQYGIEDTMMDLLFDVAGAVIVGIWGTAHLTDVVGALQERLTERAARD
ncbi:MAG TPA: hypothetical protein VJ898_05070 [Natrialbaceae archaeon]|nr:hypothetical protein [Natrialbaceae archaeon]